MCRPDIGPEVPRWFGRIDTADTPRSETAEEQPVYASDDTQRVPTVFGWQPVGQDEAHSQKVAVRMWMADEG
jgi:hypothetical protein